MAEAQARQDSDTKNATIFAGALGPHFDPDALPATRALITVVRATEKDAVDREGRVPARAALCGRSIDEILQTERRSAVGLSQRPHVNGLCDRRNAWRIAPDNKWRSFFFEAHGYEVLANRVRCPNTAAILDRIPDLVTAFFSVMEPGTHVPRHKGFTKALLNIHLGLRVPAGPERCRIQVADQSCGWADGEILMFDESFPHEVWNDSEGPRAILFIQVLRPMRRHGRLLARITVRFVNLTKYVQQARHAIGATPKRR